MPRPSSRSPWAATGVLAPGPAGAAARRARHRDRRSGRATFGALLAGLHERGLLGAPPDPRSAPSTADAARCSTRPYRRRDHLLPPRGRPAHPRGPRLRPGGQRLEPQLRGAAGDPGAIRTTPAHLGGRRRPARISPRPGGGGRLSPATCWARSAGVARDGPLAALRSQSSWPGACVGVVVKTQPASTAWRSNRLGWIEPLRPELISTATPCSAQAPNTSASSWDRGACGCRPSGRAVAQRRRAGSHDGRQHPLSHLRPGIRSFECTGATATSARRRSDLPVEAVLVDVDLGQVSAKPAPRAVLSSMIWSSWARRRSTGSRWRRSAPRRVVGDHRVPCRARAVAPSRTAGRRRRRPLMWLWRRRAAR